MKQKTKKVVNQIKRGFTIIEVLIATIILASFTYLGLSIMKDYTASIVDQEKMNYAQRIASNYMEGIENIRTSAWIDAMYNPSNDVNGRVNFDRCGGDLSSFVKTDSVTPDLMGWFCKEVPGANGQSFSELKGTYSLQFKKDERTGEKKFELIKTSTEGNPGNAESYDSYSTFFVVKDKNKLQGKFNEFIDYSNAGIMEERFEGRKLEIGDFTKYFNNNLNIPGRTILVTVTFENAKDEDVEKFKDSEKEYFKKQIKKAIVKVEFGDSKNKRRAYVIERVFTNFKSSN